MNSVATTSENPVLLVEDDPDIRALAEMSLRLAGLDVITCSDGKAALARLEERRYGLVILDVMMPDMSGYEILRSIAQRMGDDSPPIALFSARPPDTIRSEAREFCSHQVHVLAKPFEPFSFGKTVEKLLRP